MKAHYALKLDSPLKFRKYCEFLEKFVFSGYIKSANLHIEKNDLVSIMKNCLLKEIQLIINICLPKDEERIKCFLLESNLIISNP